MINIVFIKGNEMKRKEVEEILGKKFNIINIKLDLPEIQSISVEDVINEKIKTAYKLLNNNFDEVIEKFRKKDIYIKDINDIIVICEDTGLYIKDMNNFPGALIKYYLESIGINGIININKGSDVKAVTVIGIIKYGKIMKPIIGSMNGKISNEIIKNNYSDQYTNWDYIFIPNLNKKKYSKYNGMTYFELNKLNIKNKISHRKNAFIKLKNKI